MAFKMMYLAIYPMAVLGAHRARARRLAHLAHETPIGWLIAAALLVVAARPALSAPRRSPSSISI